MDQTAEETPDLEMDILEGQIPAQAAQATQQAFHRALAVSPQGVLCVDAGNLVRVLPDGSKIVVAQAKPRRKVVVGQVINVHKFTDQMSIERVGV